MTGEPAGSAVTGLGYELRISPTTVDKLSVKLYDNASAVVAELVANGYDADAERLTVKLPLATQLARRGDRGIPGDGGWSVEVADDGHGMTPGEARAFYLDVGRDRRRRPEQGARSREKQRSVMGRKGIGKLAPFGICRCIEVLSAGAHPKLPTRGRPARALSERTNSNGGWSAAALRAYVAGADAR